MHDANVQTSADLANARRGTTIDVQAVRDFLFGTSATRCLTSTT
jgi:hypothetical protein